MSIPFSNTHYRIPQGFGNLLEGLTREILREQPNNIPSFAAAYFENLLEKREKTNFDPAEWGAKVDDLFYNKHAFKEQEPPEKEKTQPPEKEKSQPPEKEKSQPPEKEKSQPPVTEEAPVTVMEVSEEDKEKEENAAVKIQAVFRGHLAREEVKKMKDGDVQEEKKQEDN
ncbi:sperm surface protein Sp17 [Phyllostomus hastatus]|uniref:sperm surface protein Sp17 n=1 Tax=Phyllostomus hastatus TaxID=9423 RepID=UPI001E682BEA|nr:sperm surface protein Sp17 [Phyllostomus hastatus]XP_045716129.1 sperm surface protein Sp17 [Phyllostomus hastatus]